PGAVQQPPARPRRPALRRHRRAAPRPRRRPRHQRGAARERPAALPGATGARRRLDPGPGRHRGRRPRGADRARRAGGRGGCAAPAAGGRRPGHGARLRPRRPDPQRDLPGGGSVSTRRNAWPLVAQREIQVRLTDRNFLVSTGLTLLLVIGVFALQALCAGGPASYRVAVTGDGGAAVVAQAEEVLRASDEEATIRPVQVADEAGGEAAVEAGDADALLVRSGDGWTLSAD